MIFLVLAIFKMNIFYFSPSILPSTSANSIHVFNQSKAYAQIGQSVTLYIIRSSFSSRNLTMRIAERYGSIHPNLNIVSFYNPFPFANNIFLATFSFFHFLLVSSNKCICHSRNLYLSFLLSLFRIPQYYETHYIEHGIRFQIQRHLLSCKYSIPIFVSDALKTILEDLTSSYLPKSIVLHDAAPSRSTYLINSVEKRSLLQSFLENISQPFLTSTNYCGYFGHLYPGRGIEIIIQLALSRPSITFLVVGGNPQHINTIVSPDNIIFIPSIPHSDALYLMQLVDILLMPYQKSVSIAIKGHDTARWMSPMKMFEYMSSNNPIISSDLPVLREVLTHNYNCLLCTPDNTDDWLFALDRICNDTSLAQALSQNAFNDFDTKYTWKKRASTIVNNFLEIQLV